MTIPKIIHYVWVGGNEKSSDIKRCMRTWKKHLKDYKIIEWNESNFDINSHPFIKAAYSARKWAYVSDYIRASVIYNYGGIYLDTDIILVDRLDSLLYSKAFVGFENEHYPFTAVFGAEKGHPFVKDMLDYYNVVENDFAFENNNTISVSNILINNYGCQRGNNKQVLKEDIIVYPDYILCNPSLKSKTIHIFTGTWLNEKSDLKKRINKYIKLRLTNKMSILLYILIKKVIGEGVSKNGDKFKNKNKDDDL
jgi:hypothetical protein